MSAPRTAQLIQAAAVRLRESPNPQLDAESLFRGVSGMDRAAFLTQGDMPVSSGVAEKFEAAVLRRERHEPIQYILGVAAFWRDDFTVNDAVLIPRPETEILVEAVAARTQDVLAPSLLDLGTGSGCIVLSLLRELPDSEAVAVDLSPHALRVARANARRLGREARVEFRLSRWFDALGATETFDVVVSNPPYVSRADEPSLPRDVREFEPALALFAEGEDDISSYRSIIDGMHAHLGASGLLALEVGMGQSDRVAELLTRAGLVSIEILEDLAHIPRVVLGRRP